MIFRGMISFLETSNLEGKKPFLKKNYFLIKINFFKVEKNRQFLEFLIFFK